MALALALRVSGFGDVPDLCHIPPILPILHNHTNRRNRTNCQNRRKRTNCQTGTLVGPAQSIPSRPKPGFREEARRRSGKTARIEPPCVSHGIAPISPSSRPAPGGCVPGVFDERPNLPKPKPPAPQSPCLQPRRSFPRASRALPIPPFANRGAPALPYIWAENPGNDFGGVSVAK